jgi:NADH-quinone oxidoreductase subunit F
MCEGKGKAGDIETMQEIAEVMSAASLCALGKTGTDPLKGTLRYFKEEYEATIK